MAAKNRDKYRTRLEPGRPLDQGFKANMQETATKTPLPIRETPQSISVITEDALEARQVIDIGQVLQTASGVNQLVGCADGGGALVAIDGLRTSTHPTSSFGFLKKLRLCPCEV